MDVKSALNSLRNYMEEVGVSACLIPTSDCHDSEYVGEYFATRARLSGFTGSAGELIVGFDSAYLFTDGRYFVQAQKELEGSGIELMRIGCEKVPGIPEFLGEILKPGQVLGFDGKVVNYGLGKRIEDILSSKGCRINPCLDTSAFDIARGFMDFSTVYILDEKYAGESSLSKLEKVRKKMSKEGAQTHIITTLDDIAWLLNLRADDIPNCPVFYSYFLLSADKNILFANIDSFSEQVLTYLASIKVEIESYDSFYEKALNRENICTYDRVLLDTDRVNYYICNCLGEDRIVNSPNPSTLLKCIKNPVERKNLVEANIKDGVALVKFNRWLDEELAKGITLTELDIQEKLYEFRCENEGFIEPSFDTICAYGPNGAIVHYESSKETNATVVPGSFLLIDSGGHYYQGTTDVTRTYCVGEVDGKLKEDYTLVLKSMLKLANLSFKEGTYGSSLDMMVRSDFWAEGKDFRHGTGHGIGYLLNVHEGPTRISIGAANKKSDVIFKDGMVTSDEPGLYIEGEYGIRIENDLLCRFDKKNEFGTFLAFDYLTLAPIDTECLSLDRMSQKDIDRLNEYHRLVFDRLAPFFKGEDLEYLKKKCKEVCRTKC